MWWRKNVGFKSGDELSDLIRKARASVYPSEWYENCPFSVMESISLGTPVLGADIGGIPELVVSEKAAYGMLFRPGDADDLEDKIKKLWSDSDYTKGLKDNCRKNDFDTLEEYTKRFIELI